MEHPDRPKTQIIANDTISNGAEMDFGAIIAVDLDLIPFTVLLLVVPSPSLGGFGLVIAIS